MKTATELLQPGRWFLRENRLYEICGWSKVNPLLVTARADGTGEPQTFTLTELFAADPLARFAATTAELTPPVASTEAPEGPILDAATLPAHLLQKAGHIIRTVEAIERGAVQILAEEKNVNRTTALRRMCRVLPIPVALSTYYNYQKLYVVHQGDRAHIAIDNPVG